MKRTIYKITIFLLIFAISLGLLSGCARETDEEFLVTVEGLLEQSKAVNAICFGEGILPKEDGYTSGAYTEADEASLAAYGVSTVEEIRARIAAVYSVATCDYIDTVIFTPVRDGASVITYRRYYNGMENSLPKLMVHTSYEPLAASEVAYGNLRICSHGRARAEILVDITVSDGQRKQTLKDISLSLRYEEDGWRLDTVSYAAPLAG